MLMVARAPATAKVKRIKDHLPPHRMILYKMPFFPWSSTTYLNIVLDLTFAVAGALATISIVSDRSKIIIETTPFDIKLVQK